MRHAALLFVTFYLTWCTAPAHAFVPESLTVAANVDNCFRLLYADVPSAPASLRNASAAFRATVSNAFPLPQWAGSMCRVGQSFRSNIMTAVKNLGTQTDSLLANYLAAHYGLEWRHAKQLAARLAGCKADVLAAARKERGWRLERDLDEVVLELEGNPLPGRKATLKGREAALRRHLAELVALELPEPEDPDPAAAAAALAAHNAAVAAAFAAGQPPLVLPSPQQREMEAAFNAKYPFPVTAAQDVGLYAEHCQIWWTEYNRLPATKEDSDHVALLANRTRMVLACQAARQRDPKCKSKTYALGPLPDFACDFVPMDAKTLCLFLTECRLGGWGATAALQAHLAQVKAASGWVGAVDHYVLTDMLSAPKMARMHTNKHVISGQIQTDGVRVILPLRTHTAAAGHALGGTASGAARSIAGNQQCVADFLPPGDLATYLARRHTYATSSKNTAAGKAARKAAMAAADAILKRAREAQKAAAATTKKAAVKRKRDDKAAADNTDQGRKKRAGGAKVKKDPNQKLAHITIGPGTTHISGVDTGNANPITVATFPINAPPPARCEDIWHVTLGHWRTQTGQRRRARHTDKAVRAAKLPQLESLKTADLTLLTAAMAHRLFNYNKYWAVYGSVDQRKLAFNSYIKKQKALVKVAKRLIPNKGTVVAWGDGDFKHNMRGHAVGVGKTIEKFLKTHYASHIRVTPEFRTSCLCANCHQLNENMKTYGIVRRKNGQPFLSGGTPHGSPIRRRIHGLLQCTHCHTRWNRDQNGAINIAHVYFHIANNNGAVPLRFRRGFNI